MVNSAIFEVIVGMIFVYALLSVLVTQINTVIANVLNLRAVHLKQGIANMLSDPQIRARFMTHPLIGIVRRPLNPRRPLSAQGAETVVESDTSDVTWIDSTIFSEVMIELIMNQTPAVDPIQIYQPLANEAERVLETAERAQVRALIRQLEQGGEGMDDLLDIIENLRDPADRQAMLAAYEEVKRLQAEYRTKSSEIAAVIRGLRAIPSRELQRALDTLLVSASNMAEARRRLESWFNYNMTRVSDAFQRSIQQVTILVAIVLTLILNIDTLQVARSLWEDPALRNTVVVAAQTSIETGERLAQIEIQQAEAAQTRAPSSLVPRSRIAEDEQMLAEAQEAISDSVNQTRDTLSRLFELRLPLGWSYVEVRLEPLQGEAPIRDSRNLWNYVPVNNPDGWVSLAFAKIIGLVLTVVAISQGAPFWYDLLRRITGTQNNRNTVDQ